MSTETKHTKEPLAWSGRKIPHYRGGEHTELEIHTAYDDGQLHKPYPIVSLSVGIGLILGDVTIMVNLSEANARRIVACVNACAGITNEQLTQSLCQTVCPACGSETANSNQVMINQRISTLEAQNRELREAYDAACAFIDRHVADPDITAEMCRAHSEFETKRKALSDGG